MPSVSAYKKAFNLLKGEIFSDKYTKFILENIHIGHKEVKRYSEYSFPIRLEFKGPNIKFGEKILMNFINTKITSKNGKIVNSDYGNPYECTIGEPQIEDVRKENDHNIYIVRSEGYAFRRRDLPSERKTYRSKSAKTLKEYQPNIEIVKSRFSTSKCKKCNQKINIGSTIAKMKIDKNMRGGWSHLECL
jgi:hypothetical protein